MKPTKLLVISSNQGWHVATMPAHITEDEALIKWMQDQGYGSQDWEGHISACAITVKPGIITTEEIHLSDPVLEALDDQVYKWDRY